MRADPVVPPGRVGSGPAAAPPWRDRVLFAAAVLVQLLVLYAPRAPGPGGVAHLDKLVHLVVFAAVVWTGRRVGISALVLGAVLGGHAVVSEVLQATALGERTGEIGDVVADLAGVGLGLVVPTGRRSPSR